MLSNIFVEIVIDKKYLNFLNSYGYNFRKAKEEKNTKEISRIRREYKNMLPEGFLQKAAYSMNYETAMTMYFQRRNHRL